VAESPATPPAAAPNRRWPRRVFDAGTEPDPRFSLANERTFLAGIRTALALLAAGVALEALAVPVEPRLRLAAALVLVGLACVSTLHAAASWARTERAMRLRAPCPRPGGSPRSSPPASGVSIMAAAALVLLCGVVALLGLPLLAGPS
jgi:putative membrane protein